MLIHWKSTKKEWTAQIILDNKNHTVINSGVSLPFLLDQYRLTLKKNLVSKINLKVHICFFMKIMTKEKLGRFFFEIVTEGFQTNLAPCKKSA